MQVCIEEHRQEDQRFKVFDENGVCRYYGVEDKLTLNNKIYLYNGDTNEKVMCISQALINWCGRFKIINKDNRVIGRVKMKGAWGRYQKVVYSSIYGKIIVKRRYDSDRYKIYYKDRLIGAMLKKGVVGRKYILDVKNDEDIVTGISLVIVLMLCKELIMYRKMFR